MRDGCGWCFSGGLIVDEDDTAMLDHYGRGKMVLIKPYDLNPIPVFRIKYCPMCGRSLHTLVSVENSVENVEND